jgi:uncharacterized protein with HEPN domain
MPENRPARLRLFDMLDSIAGIERLAADVKARSVAFSAENWRAVERWLEIISEASRHLPADMKAREAGVPWRQVADLGNVIRHNYDRIDTATLTVIVEDDLPALKAAAERLYQSCKLPADPWP